MKEDLKNQFPMYRLFDDGINEPVIYSYLTKKYLQPTVNKNGYKQVTVKNALDNKVTLNYARLIMILAHPQEDYSTLEVDHINRDSTDDRLCNLRWISRHDNRMNRTNAKRPHRDVPIVIVFDNGQQIYYTHKMKDLINIPYTTVYNLANRKEGTNYSPKYGITCYYKQN